MDWHAELVQWISRHDWKLLAGHYTMVSFLARTINKAWTLSDPIPIGSLPPNSHLLSKRWHHGKGLATSIESQLLEVASLIMLSGRCFSICLQVHKRTLPTLFSVLTHLLSGKQRREDVTAMVDKYPLWNEYWEDKKPKLGNIKVPMYACASYSSGLHTEGSIRGFLLSSSKEKW